MKLAANWSPDELVKFMRMAATLYESGEREAEQEKAVLYTMIAEMIESQAAEIERLKKVATAVQKAIQP